MRKLIWFSLGWLINLKPMVVWYNFSQNPENIFDYRVNSRVFWTSWGAKKFYRKRLKDHDRARFQITAYIHPLCRRFSNYLYSKGYGAPVDPINLK